MEAGKRGECARNPNQSNSSIGKVVYRESTYGVLRICHSVFAGTMRNAPRVTAGNVQRCGSWKDIHMHEIDRSARILAEKVRN